MPAPNEAKPDTGSARERQVRTIFSEIAPRYDLLNHLLSLNIDRTWRRWAVDELDWEREPDGWYLDACAGTFDLSLELCRREGFGGRVMASDFAAPMLLEGKPKVTDTPIFPVCGDTLRLPFPDESFEGAMVAFGVRNLSDLPRGFKEFRRVLKPGGRLVVLEFTEPPNPVLRHLYLFYFRRILPVLGRLVSGHPWAYTYLPESVKEFPDPDGLEQLMRGAAFARTSWRFLSGGVAAIHIGIR
ncbi:MAG: class I SAM-dependent methyltransferase [Gemmatimonadetes bacterium]|nr:class I SAM-dependent methyltransferase [Gemmatimonadota bacterium]NNM05636.1 class I SAM-dependent methyltransferase [Gemmatimonadota bacterium]